MLFSTRNFHKKFSPFIELLTFRIRLGPPLGKMSVDKVKRKENGKLAGAPLGFVKVW